MTSPVILGVCFGIVVCVFVLQMLWLRVGAKVCRIPNTTWGRVAAAVFIVTLVGYAFTAADLFFMNASSLPTVAALSAINLLIFFAVIKLVLRTSVAKAMGAGAIQLVLLAISAIPLILILRAAALQTYSFSTGSMAPTLQGRHRMQVCPACGFRFAIGLDQSPMGAHQSSAMLICPNCRQPQSDQSVEAQPDHIVVDKTTMPKRWELMAYRNPRDTNLIFVHRLVGLPGDQVELAKGDVFIDGKRLAKPPNEINDLWFLVNDSSFSAESSDDSQAWRAEDSGGDWRRTNGEWQCNSTNASPQRLTLAWQIDDSLFYNQRVQYPGQPHVLGDVKVEIDLSSFSGAGGLGFDWSFDDLRVECRIDSDGGVSLLSGEQGASGRLDHALAATRRVVFGIRDGRAFVVEGGRLVTSMTIGPQDLETVRVRSDPREACGVAISAERCNVAIKRIALFRDVYYRDEEWRSNATPSARAAMMWGGGRPFTLGTDEFYVLGDNSAMSMDSRYANEMDPTLMGRYQPGTVPREVVVGAARIIHWPPERWHVFQ